MSSAAIAKINTAVKEVPLRLQVDPCSSAPECCLQIGTRNCLASFFVIGCLMDSKDEDQKTGKLMVDLCS